MLMNCIRCGQPFDEQGVEWMSDDLLERFRSTSAFCRSCSELAARKAEEAAAEAERAERQKKLDEKRVDRIAESQLDLYRMDYDPEHPGANGELLKWMFGHIENCVWLVGESGTCKTRVIQEAARLAVRDRSVRYWPTADLAAHLLETAKHPESTLWDCYRADLLILDDLGKESLTAARMASIEAIVDHRYIGWDQARREQGTSEPYFGFYAKRKLGGQLWITSQAGPEELAARFSAINREDAAAIIRRLSEMCVLHRC